MREPPPPALAELLKSLGLVSEDQLRRFGGEVRRLAGGMPRFESIWLDALVQHQWLTRWQAAEIAAGDGAALAVGPYLLEEPAAGCLLAPTYRARRREDRQPIRLTLIPSAGTQQRDELAGQIARLVDESKLLSRLRVDGASAAPILEHGRQGERLWVASPWTEGRTAAQWMIRTGRFPSEVVLHVARAMTAVLAGIEKHDLVHGDLSLASLLITPEAEIVLLHPGLRTVLRPAEAYGRAELPPEAFDTLSPQRITDGSPPDGPSDRYACGVLWLHMLGGRAPLAGGNALAKLRAAHEARLPGLDELGVEAPAVLVETLQQCVARNPADRPESFAAMAARLGPPTPQGRDQLRRMLEGCSRAPLVALDRPGTPRVPTAGGVRRMAAAATVAAVLIVGAIAVRWLPLSQYLPGSWLGRGETVAARATPAPPAQPQRPGITEAARRDDSATTKTLASDDRGSEEGQADPPRTGTASASPSDEPAPLPTGAPIELASLKLRPGQVLKPADGGRATIHVPPTGLRLEVVPGDGAAVQPARVENVDFVWRHTPTADAAMLLVHADSLALENCTFRVAGAEGGGNLAVPVAVRWSGWPSRGPDELALPSGWLRLSRCRLAGVSAAVDCRVRGAVRLECDNLLHLGPGPLIRTPEAPASDEPMVVDLRRVTLRRAEALWLCRHADRHRQPGPVWIRAEQSIFMPRRDGLLVLEAADEPTALLGRLRWTGEGSLVGRGLAIAGWRRPGGTCEPMDDSQMPIAGLVRSRVEFAAAVGIEPGASRPVHYQAPLRSIDPPGAVLEQLP